jgi:hypothetical protein
MDFRSRIFANSRGSTIDAVGNGQYLVCHHTSCFKVMDGDGPMRP